jgi:ubiquinone/menaquinone biosynthesis C-methylase UbiE
MTGHDDHAFTGWKAALYALLHRNPASNRAVVDWAELRPGMDTLDVGCGTGAAVLAAAPQLPDGTAVGVDPSDDFVRIARRRARRLANVEFQVAVAERLPFDSGRFDVVWSVHSSHHWHDLASGIAEVRRVLRPGGRFLIVERHDPDKPWGISMDEAESLSETMTKSRFLQVTVDERPVKRITEFVIAGSTPAEDH